MAAIISWMMGWIFLTFTCCTESLLSNKTVENNRISSNETMNYYADPCAMQTQAYRDIIFSVLLVFIFIIAVLGNSFAIIVIAYSKTLRSHPSNIFIASLAASDLGVAFFTIPIRLDGYIHRQNFCYNIHVCKMFNFTDLLFHISSVSHLFMIAIERFLAIKEPFTHQTLMTKKATFLCILATWLYCTVWSVLGIFDWETRQLNNMKIYDNHGMRVCVNENPIYFTSVYTVTYIIPLCIMGILYAAILKIAMKQARAVAALRPHHLRPPTTGKRSASNKNDMRATKTLAIVYGAFVVCWLPVTIITLTSNWCPQCYLDFRRKHEFSFMMVIALFIETLPPLNSCMNPFVYILFNREFRKEFQNLLLKMLRKPRKFDEDYHTYRIEKREATEAYELSDETFSQRSASPTYR